MKIKTALYLCCLITLLFWTPIAAQPQFRFERLGIQEGLSHSLVNSILQDSRGFLWIGTQDGLNRYDGYDFRVFHPEPGAENGIFGRWVTELFEDSHDQLWIRFRTGGLNRYNPVTQRFHLYLHDPDDPTSISGNLASEFRFSSNMESTMLESSDGTLWIGTTNGLNRYDRSSDSFRRFLHRPGDSTSLVANSITTLLEDRHGYLWIGTTDGLCRLDPRTGRFRQLRHDVTAPEKSLSDNFIRTLYQDGDGIVWVGTRWGGLNRIEVDSVSGKINIQASLYDPQIPPHERRDEITVIRESRSGELLVGGESGLFIKAPGGETFRRIQAERPIKPVQFIHEDSKGHCWIANNELKSGLIRLSPDRQEVAFYDHYDQPSISLSSNAINCIMEDRMGVLWIGTVKGGVNKVDLHRKPFQHFFHNSSNPNSLNADDVYAIYQDEEHTLWVGTNIGLNRIDRRSGKVKTFEKRPGAADGLPGRIVGVIEPDSSGFLWLGYFDHKISRFFPDEGRFEHFEHQELVPDSYLAWSLRDILIDSRGDTWFGACSHGLTRLNEDGRTFSYFMPQEDKPANHHEFKINCLLEDSSGSLWIGFQKKGLYRFDPRTGQFTAFQYDHRDPTSLNNNEVKCIVEDPSGDLWLGTGGGGLNRFHRQDATFSHFTTADGLASNTVSGILPDDRGRWWLSTNGGLSRFDPETGVFHNYYVEDGLQSNEFNEGAYFRTAEGELLFGGVNGVTAFYPDSIQENPFPPQVAITDFRIFYERVQPGDSIEGEVVLSKAIEFTDELVLTHEQSVFSFEFAALHFAAPNKNRFAYRLEGFDRDWIYTDARQRTATYTSLDPGSYTFRVKAANNDGRWDEAGIAIQIRILPPWWDTALFRRSLFLALLLAVFLLIRLRIRRLKKQKLQLEREVALRTRELSEANIELEESRQAVLRQKELIEQQKLQVEKKNRNIHLLSEMGQNITSTIRIEEIMVKICRSVRGLMDAPSFSIGQIDEEGAAVHFFVIEEPGNELATLKVSLSDRRRLSVWAIENGEMVFTNDLEREVQDYFDDVPASYISDVRYRSVIYLPLRAADDSVIGILIVKSTHRNSYTSFHLSVLKNLAAYIAIALDNARAYGAIEQQSERLRRLDTMKTHFFTNISHELRTPLALIMGAVKDMEGSGNLTPAQVRGLAMLERNAKRLLRLVTQIMDLSKLEGGALKLQIAHIPVVQHLLLVADSFEALARQRDIRFSVSANQRQGEGFVDRDKIEKIVYNLLYNAFKFTDRGGQVNLDLYLDRRQKGGQWLEITVRDTGVGIPESELPRIFQRFYQGTDNTARHSEGAGIGLALVQRLVDLHQGTVKVNSRTGKDDHGTTFIVRIPLDAAAYRPRDMVAQPIVNPDYQLNLADEEVEERERSMDKTTAPPAMHVRPTILVVEDNADMLGHLRRGLQQHYEVLEARDGRSGLEIATSHHPKVILSDVMMSHLDGYELCRRLKEEVTTSHIPVIMLTAKSSLGSEVEGLRSGADDYITKPFRMEVLLLKLQNIIEGRRKLADRYRRDVWMEADSLAGTPADEALLRRATEVIEEHLSNPDLDVALFTREMGMGRTALYEKIKALTGYSINELIKIHRLKIAARLLLEQRLSVGEVSYEVGFNDPKYFSKCFKKQFGKTPKAFVGAYV